MSRKLEITSCSECPNATYSMANMGTMCEILPLNERMIDTEEIGDSGEKIWSKCPLEDYNASFNITKRPVLNRHAVGNAFGLKERSPLRQEYEEHVSVTEPVEAPVEMKELVALIEYSSYTEYYYAPDGNSHASHPAKLNEFIHRVNESGGNILSMQIISDQRKYSIHYSVPVGTYPISV